MAALTEDTIKQQSIQTYRQWAHQWREHADMHGKRFTMKSLNDFMHIGIGKAALLVANGHSFEQKVDIIKKNQANVDVICCDKTLGHCLENGIIPKICVLCDANVSYEKYCEKYKSQLSQTILIANVCANPSWAMDGNWKDIYFFVNRDSIESEKEFIQISGCKNVIVAGTNVSNAMLILITQCDETGARNFFGYDKILLIGFDYSWKEDAYYAFDCDGSGKVNYMKGVYCLNLKNELVFSSPNLIFSAKWLTQYINTFRLRVIQCSGDSILAATGVRNLEEQMQYNHMTRDSALVRKLVKMRDDLSVQIKMIDNQLNGISYDHQIGYLSSI